MAKVERELKASRTLGGQILVLGLSFVPIILGVLALRAKWIRSMLVYTLYLLFMATGYWVGSRWHKLIRLDNDSSGDPADDPISEHRFDWLAMVSALVVGFGVMFFLRAIFSHGMARAFTEFMPSGGDD